MCGLNSQEIQLYCLFSENLLVVEARDDGVTLDALQDIPGFAGDTDFDLPRANKSLYRRISQMAGNAISTLCIVAILCPVPCDASVSAIREAVAKWQPMRLVL